MASLLGIGISIESCIALASLCREACAAAKQYPEETERIRERLNYLLSEVPKWASRISVCADNLAHQILLKNLYNSLEHLSLCVEALGESQEGKWRKRIQSLLEGKFLLDQLNDAESKLNLALQDLNHDNTSYLTSQMHLFNAKLDVVNTIHDKISLMHSSLNLLNSGTSKLSKYYDDNTETYNSGVRHSKFSYQSKASDASGNIDTASIICQSTEGDIPFLLENQNHVYFDKKQRIGVGGFAKVFKGKYKNDDVAIKVIDIYRNFDRFEKMPNEVYQAECDRVRNEAILMKHCSIHPKIVDVFGYCNPVEKGSKPFIIMELMAWSLNTILHDEKQLSIPFAKRFKLMRDIASAIEFLHIQGIIHQDIKASNILINSECTVAKLTDFGVAERKGFQTTWSMRQSEVLATVLKNSGKKVAGTRSYQAPEIILEEVSETSCTAEIYSFGVTIWECLTREIPHHKKEDRLRELANESTISMLPFPIKAIINEPNLSSEEQKCFNTLEMIAFLCLSKQRMQRPSATQIIQFFDRKRTFCSDLVNSQFLSTWTEAINKDSFLIPSSYDVVKDNISDPSITVESLFAEIHPSQSCRELSSATCPGMPRPCANVIYGDADESEVNGNESQSAFNDTKMAISEKLHKLHQERLKRRLRIVVSIIGFILSLVVIVSIVSTRNLEKTPATAEISCFKTNDELRSSVIAFVNYDPSVRKKYGNSIGDWCVDYIEDFSKTFHDPTGKDRLSNFDVDISKWNTSAAKKMSSMFAGARKFNQDLKLWDVKAVTDMSNMFYNAKLFDQDLSKWNVSVVTDMKSMFEGAFSFNKDLSSWDVSIVTDMSYMFRGAENFNQNLAGWNVSAVNDMTYMFFNAYTFRQNLCQWGNQLTNGTTVTNMFRSQRSTSCPDQNDPLLSNISEGPFCYTC